MEDDQGGGLTYLSTDLRMHMDISLVDNAVTRHFCTKTIEGGGSYQAWPAGNLVKKIMYVEKNENNEISISFCAKLCFAASTYKRYSRKE